MAKIGNESSPQTTTSRGGAQGSCLTSTLVLIMLIDINLFIDEGELSSYCVDNTLTSTGDSTAEAAEKAQKESENIIGFFRLNKLACNIGKSEVIVIRPNRKTSKEKVILTTDGTSITEKESLNIFGLRFRPKYPPGPGAPAFRLS